jgi:hypothetical protein
VVRHAPRLRQTAAPPMNAPVMSKDRVAGSGVALVSKV